MIPFILALFGTGFLMKTKIGKIITDPMTTLPDRIGTVIGNLQTVPTQAQIDADAWSKLRASMIQKEGYKNKVYKDSLGKLTVGIGHLVLPKDNLKYGDTISNERVEALFLADLTSAFNMAKRQAKELGRYNSEMIVALTHVCFQSGNYWNTIHVTAWNALKKGDGQKAINALLSSLWYRQTPVRVADFVTVIKNQFA